MPMYAKKHNSTFKPCPEGLWPGRCIDLVDKGMKATDYGPKHQVQIRWIADAEPSRPDGKPYMVTAKYNLSMGKKAKLRLAIETWRGKVFTDQEAYSFDIEKLLGVQCQLQVAQKEGDEGPYAFVQLVMRPAKGQNLPALADYVRECNRPGYVAPVIPDDDEEPATIDSDDPFGGALPEVEQEERTPF